MAVWLLQVAVSDTGLAEASVSNTPLHPEVSHRFPWCEYIVRAGWLPTGDSVWLQLLGK